MKVSLPAFLTVLLADRFSGEAVLKFRNGHPVAITLLTGRQIPLESPADGSHSRPLPHHPPERAGSPPPSLDGRR